MRGQSWIAIGWAMAIGSASGCSSSSLDSAGAGSGTGIPVAAASAAGTGGSVGPDVATFMMAAGNAASRAMKGAQAAGSGGATGREQAEGDQSVAGGRAGSAGAAAAGALAGSSGHAADGGSASDEDAELETSSGTLPAVSDLEEQGAFTPVIVDGTGPNGSYRMDHPKELAETGLKHPIVVFAAGGGFPENYDTLLRYLASHGFVVLSYAATDDQGKEVLDGIDWLSEQNAASSGMLSAKLDIDHVAAAGHSFGSLAVFNAASDPRLTTTIHLQGGTLDPHSEVSNLRAPAQFICGERPSGDQDGTWAGDMANPNCEIDFERATVPVFYGSLKGAAHIQLTESVEDADDPLRKRMLAAIGGWLRWWLAADDTQRARYVGDDCGLCQPNTGWTIKQKGLM